MNAIAERLLEAAKRELWENPSEGTLDALRGVLLDTETLLEDYMRQMQSEGLEDSYDLLTDREKEVLEMLVAGRSNKEIGGQLGIEERTVKAHVAKLMRKVGVQNRIALSVHAITHSLVATK